MFNINSHVSWLRVSIFASSILFATQVSAVAAVVGDPFATNYPNLYPEPQVLGIIDVVPDAAIAENSLDQANITFRGSDIGSVSSITKTTGGSVHVITVYGTNKQILLNVNSNASAANGLSLITDMRQRLLDIIGNQQATVVATNPQYYDIFYTFDGTRNGGVVATDFVTITQAAQLYTLSGYKVSQTESLLNWRSTTYPADASGYKIYRNGTLVTTINGESNYQYDAGGGARYYYSDSNLTCGTTYSYYVQGVVSGVKSNTASVATSECVSGGAIIVTQPYSSSSWELEHTYKISWSTLTMGPQAETVQLSLINAAGGTPYVIAKEIPDKSEYTWTIPADLPTAYLNLVKVSVEFVGTKTGGLSEVFTIASTSVVTPKAGEILQQGQPYKFQWLNRRSLQQFNLSLQSSSIQHHVVMGLSAQAAGCSNGGTCTYSWIPDIAGPELSLVVNDAITGTASVSGIFTITAGSTVPQIKLISPQGGEQWQVGRGYTIGWLTAGIPQSYLSSYPVFQLLDAQGQVKLTAPNESFTAGVGYMSVTIPAEFNLVVGSSYQPVLNFGGTSNLPLMQAKANGLVTIVSQVTPRTCSGTSSTVQEPALGNATFGVLDINTHLEILRYRIQWFSGGWSGWYTPGVDDVDWKINPDGSLRRVWAYFGDHTHEYEKCSTAPVVRPPQNVSLSDIKQEASSVTTGQISDVGGMDQVRAAELLARAEIIIQKIQALQVELKSLAPALSSIKDFIAFGTPSTQSLGAGERAGVVASFTEAFGKPPSDAADWEDAVKIANGRFPTQRSTGKEQVAEAKFKQIYKRVANRSESKYDDAAVTVMAYGLRPAARNLVSEAAALKSFKAVYGKTPTAAADWDTVRAVAYSGASRELKKTNAADADHDGLSDADEVKYGTDPKVADTDGDGYTDGTEVKSGYDPLAAAPAVKPNDEVKTPAEVGQLVVVLAPIPANPPSGLHTAGTTDKTVAAFKFEATGESFMVRGLTLQPYVKGSVSDASNDRVAVLKLDYPTITMKPMALPAFKLDGTAVKVDLSADPLYVPENGSVDLRVLVDWAPFTLLNGTEDESIAFGLDADNSLGGNLAVGQQSGGTVSVWGTSDPAGYPQAVYRTVLAVAPGTGTPNNTQRVRSAAQRVASWNFSVSSSTNAFFRLSDSIIAHISGNLSTNPVTFYLKDTGGTVRAQGTSDANSSSRDVVLTPVTSDIEISQTTLALDLETNTSMLMAPDTPGNELLSVSVSTGTLTTAGDFRWYDSSDSAGGNDMPAITVTNPTATTVTFTNTY